MATNGARQLDRDRQHDCVPLEPLALGLAEPVGDPGRRLLSALWGHYWMKRLDKFYRSPLPWWIAESDDTLVPQLWGIDSPEPPVHGKDYTPVLFS